MKTFVMIPTYNEKENIVKLIDSIFSLGVPGLEVIVVDDNSPDGTWKLVDDAKKKHDHLHLIVRKTSRGRGSAGIVGYKYCLKHHADYIVEMDADFSHNPKYIPKILEKIKECDVVLGSRMVKGGKDVGRTAIRQIITKLANLYIGLMLGIKAKDCNSGYRCFKRKVLESIGLDKIVSKGPSIVQEVLFKAHLKKFKICEIPITFKERVVGSSKLGSKELYKGYIMVFKLKFMHIVGKI